MVRVGCVCVQQLQAELRAAQERLRHLEADAAQKVAVAAESARRADVRPFYAATRMLEIRSGVACVPSAGLSAPTGGAPVLSCMTTSQAYFLMRWWVCFAGVPGCRITDLQCPAGGGGCGAVTGRCGRLRRRPPRGCGGCRGGAAAGGPRGGAALLRRSGGGGRRGPPGRRSVAPGTPPTQRRQEH